MIVRKLLFLVGLWSLSLFASSEDCPTLMQNRQEMVTSPAGEPVPFIYSKDGKEVQAEASLQLEYERRIQLGVFPLKFEDYSLDAMVSYETSADVVRSLLTRTFGQVADGRSRFIGAAIPAPLASKEAHFHGAYRAGQIPDIPTPDRFTTLLDIEFTREHDYMSWDKVRAKYVVGLQQETSVYYDTSKNSLAAVGIAVRMKEWQPLHTDGTAGETVAWSLFVKKSTGEMLGSAEQGFTIRSEYQYRFSQRPNQKEITAAALGLLKAIGIDGVSDFQLTPIVEIQNTRFGLDLSFVHSFQEREKVGYIVVDDFQGKNLRTGRGTGRLAQIEFELLPDKREFFLQRPKSIEDTLSMVERMFNGKATTVPKYQLVLQSSN